MQETTRSIAENQTKGTGSILSKATSLVSTVRDVSVLSGAQEGARATALYEYISKLEEKDFKDSTSEITNVPGSRAGSTFKMIHLTQERFTALRDDQAQFNDASNFGSDISRNPLEIDTEIDKLYSVLQKLRLRLVSMYHL